MPKWSLGCGDNFRARVFRGGEISPGFVPWPGLSRLPVGPPARRHGSLRKTILLKILSSPSFLSLFEKRPKTLAMPKTLSHKPYSMDMPRALFKKSGKPLRLGQIIEIVFSLGEKVTDRSRMFFRVQSHLFPAGPLQLGSASNSWSLTGR